MSEVIKEVSSPKQNRKFVIITVKNDSILKDAVGPSGEPLVNVERKYVKYMNPAGLKRMWPPTSDDNNM